METMQLVERHIIDRKDSRFEVIDCAAFASKNLYNAALYETRQAFFEHGTYPTYEHLCKQMKQHEAYKALPAKVSQQVLRLLEKNWKSFKEALAAYYEDPSKFRARPAPPRYKHKTEGRNILVYTLQALSGGRGKGALQQGIIKPSMLPIEIRTRQDPKTIDQVRIVPRNGFYVVEVVYNTTVKPASLNPAYSAGIDLGVDNLMALTSNKPGFVPRIVNGRPIKSINQWYNKRRAELQKLLGHTGTTKRLERMTNKRNRRIEQYMHTASKRVIDLLVKEGIGTLVIGKNDGWKQEIEHGKRNNQNFCAIPHAHLIEMLTYKAQLAGIRVQITEESYTSKASLLDLDPLPMYQEGDKMKHKFRGKRVERGLYRASNGRFINADVNGAGNIIRKVAPDAFQQAEGVEDGERVFTTLVVHPVRIVVPVRTRKARVRQRKQNARLFGTIAKVIHSAFLLPSACIA